MVIQLFVYYNDPWKKKNISDIGNIYKTKHIRNSMARKRIHMEESIITGEKDYWMTSRILSLFEVLF